MARSEPEFLVVGQIGRPHGTRGELVVHSRTDNPGYVFVPGAVLRPGNDAGQAPEPDLPPLRIGDARPFQRGWLVTFDGIDDRNAAEQLRNRYLLIERSLLPPLEKGEVFRHELLGLEVVTTDGARVGEVIEVYELRPADLLEVRTDRGTVLVPFVETMIRELDVAGGRLVIDPPEGLLEP